VETKLNAEPRTDAGKGVARKLRAAGRVPAVLYGQGTEPVSLSVDAHEMTRVLHSGAGSNVLLDLVVDGTEHLVIPRQIQRNHIRNTLIHIDFLAVSRSETITVDVPVHEIGEAIGVKEGGVVEHHLRDLRIECLPQDVPDHIEVDITDLSIGDMIHVGDIVPPDGVTILTTAEDAVLSVITPAALRVEADLGLPGEEGVEVPEGELPEGEAPAATAEGGEPAPAAEEGGGED
jgi:large subunit ribosomal protein L25